MPTPSLIYYCTISRHNPPLSHLVFLYWVPPSERVKDLRGRETIKLIMGSLFLLPLFLPVFIIDWLADNPAVGLLFFLSRTNYTTFIGTIVLKFSVKPSSVGVRTPNQHVDTLQVRGCSGGAGIRFLVAAVCSARTVGPKDSAD